MSTDPKTLGEGVAFPTKYRIQEMGMGGIVGEGTNPGMNLRTYIATAALQGILANPESWLIGSESRSERAVKEADSLLKELAKGGK